MRVVLQRVSAGRVSVDGRVIAQIERGLVLLVGIAPDDTEEKARQLVEKIANLRIFEDQQGKMNLSLLEVGGAALVVSQFTLYADARKGRRPNLDGAAPADEARVHFEAFVEALRSRGPVIRVGRFQETMEVESVNDGPVTILLDSPADRTAGDGREAEYGTTSPQG